MNETRIGFFRSSERDGRDASAEENRRHEGGEWVADLVVVTERTARRATVTRDDVPTMVDELPLLACLAARAEGETLITGANELRVKESDRITAVVIEPARDRRRRRGAAGRHA